MFVFGGLVGLDACIAFFPSFFLLIAFILVQVVITGTMRP